MVIHAVPSLKVLDLHQVTAAERKAAETALGGRGVLLTVAFGKRCPPHDAAWDAKVGFRFQGPTIMVLQAASLLTQTGGLRQLHCGSGISIMVVLLLCWRTSQNTMCSISALQHELHDIRGVTVWQSHLLVLPSGHLALK